MNKFYLLGEDFLKGILQHLVSPNPINILPICDALRTLKAHEAPVVDAVKGAVDAVESAVADVAK